MNEIWLWLPELNLPGIDDYNNKSRMNIKHKLIIGTILLLMASTLFADWGNFKAGLAGKPPIKEVPN